MKTLVEKIPPPIRSLLAFGCLAGGLVFFGLLGGLIAVGHPYAIPHIVYTAKPLPNLLVALAGLFGWYVLRRGYRNTAAEWGRFAAKCVMLAVSLVFSLFVGEVFLRGYLMQQQSRNSMERFKELKAKGEPIRVHSSHPLAAIVQPSEDEKLVYELQPGLEMEFGHRLVRVNAEGMRDSENYPVARSPHSVRIVGIGDSGMFGWNVEQNEDYLSVLETNLNQRADGVKYEVLNLGVPGYNTQLEVECLRNKGLAYHPDIVIVGWCDNDFQLPFFMVQKENFKRRDVSYLYNLFFARDRLAEALAGTRVERHEHGAPEGESPDNGPEGPVKAVESALADLKGLAQTNGFQVLVFGPIGRRETLEICERLGLPAYNTWDRIDGSKYPKEWAVHFMHPRAEGHRVLAEHLEKDLDQRGWLRPRD